MRRMSFALTTPQVLDESKTVTRRTGWKNLKAGDRLHAVKKAMGFRKGETAPAPLKTIEVIDVRRQPLNALLDGSAWALTEIDREGFGHLTPAQFVEMFCESHRGCRPNHLVTRIEFRYVEGAR